MLWKDQGIYKKYYWSTNTYECPVRKAYYPL